MSLQCFAFTFSKAGTVWAYDCDEGLFVASFAKTSSGELRLFSWNSPDVRNNITLMRFNEEGDQITYTLKNLDSNDVYTNRVSLAGGVFTTIDTQINNKTLTRNGLLVKTGEKLPSLDKCPQTSTAYKMVFPNSTRTANSDSQNSESDSSDPKLYGLLDARLTWELNYGKCDEKSQCLAYKRKFPKEYADFVDDMKNGPARRERAKRECAAAGDIDRCIRIKTGKE